MTNFLDFEPDDAMRQLDIDLGRDARCFEARHDPTGPSAGTSYFVFDGEYQYDLESYRAYVAAEGKNAPKVVRWTFHRLVAVSWMVVHFPLGAKVPDISPPVVLTLNDFSERAMTEQVFAALRQNHGAILTSWGGECKDFAVLRQNAASFGLRIPPALLNMSPYCRERLDLCSQTSGKATNMHLPEMAYAVGIPSKPSPSGDVGPLIMRGKWPEVRDQVLADVLTTAVIMVRHLSAFGQIECDQEASILALAEAAQTEHPSSDFVRRTFQPWAKAKCVRAGLRGLVEAA